MIFCAKPNHTRDSHRVQLCTVWTIYTVLNKSKSKDCNRQKQCILHYFQHHNVVSCNNKIEFDVKYTAFRNVYYKIFVILSNMYIDDKVCVWRWRQKHMIFKILIIKQNSNNKQRQQLQKYLNELYDFLCVDVNHF